MLSLSWIIELTAPLFEVFGQEISGRDLILILGGAFVIAKRRMRFMSGSRVRRRTAPAQTASFAGVIVQILALDEVFSLDSVITAVGMDDELFIMVAAVTIAIGIMLVSAGAISAFVNQHPTVKMLALAFLVLIGASLLGEGLDFHTPKGYVYGPIAFAILVEAVNLRYRPFRLAGATCTSSRCTCARRTSKRGAPVVDQRHAQSGPDRSPDQARPGE